MVYYKYGDIMNRVLINALKIVIPILLIVMIMAINTTKVLETPRMLDFSHYNKEQIETKCKDINVKLKIKYVVNNDLDENTFISQSIKKGNKYNENSELIVTFSKRTTPTTDDYRKYNVDELGVVPIMMYHGIENIENNKYTGGNVDKDGYNRTVEAFKTDLDMYYQKGYRMIRLIDYINGSINVPIGKSPIVLTFDDGNKNNMNILGLDKDGKLIIDSNCAVGILESFKKKYPDYNVTATFFLTDTLFSQPKYNNDILKWLVNNGYDIGNHTLGHVNFYKVDETATQKDVAYMYQKFDEIIPNKYIKVVALPYGSPGSTTHPNFKYIISGEYNGYKYQTIGTLREGWEPNPSPFSKSFNPLFMKRIRAYDNNGKDFDIESTFKNLDSDRYISDGNKDTITIKDDSNLKEGINKKITKY